MSKAILVIDMPSMCINCPCFKYEMNDTGICCANVNDEKAYGLDIKSKPNWCPLKPIPQKQGVKSIEFIPQGRWGAYENSCFGWNACIDEILGE